VTIWCTVVPPTWTGSCRLADGWTVRAAADWTWARCHVSTWQHLVGERGWSPAEYTERTVRSILAEVVTPEGPASA
jgi:hypothetical protein